MSFKRIIKNLIKNSYTNIVKSNQFIKMISNAIKVKNRYYLNEILLRHQMDQHLNYIYKASFNIVVRKNKTLYEKIPYGKLKKKNSQLKSYFFNIYAKYYNILISLE